MRRVICAVFIAAGIAACAAVPVAAAKVADPPRSAAPGQAPGFDEWETGKELYMYHRVQGSCETLTHAHGRNAAWGLWKMPLSSVSDSAAEENEDGGARVRFTCTDDTACIGKGFLESTPERVAEHTIPFETMDLARAYTVKVANLRTACGLAP